LIKHLGAPEAQGLDLDSPEAMRAHRAILQRNKVLKRLYQDCYWTFGEQMKLLAPLPGRYLELGSGGGFLKDVFPDVTTSDMCKDPGVDRVIDASRLPYSHGELKGIFLLNVLHHLPDVMAFFKEADRCLVRGGRLVMIEPYNSWLGRIVYKNLHHEPFDETAQAWSVQGSGRLTGSNQALPWIIFSRDQPQFEKHFPNLKIVAIQPHTILRYLLSGGLSWRAMAPAFSYRALRGVDGLLSRWTGAFPLFQTIVLESDEEELDP